MWSKFADWLLPVPFDSALERRKELQAIKHSDVINDSSIDICCEYIENGIGQIQYCKCIYPSSSSKSVIKGMICFCMGYTDHSDWAIYKRGLNFAKRGYIFFIFDHIGHGRSDGKFGLISDFNQLVQNSIFLCMYARSKYGPMFQLKNDQYFLMGESMGGAVAIKMALLMKNNQQRWRGLLLAAPMVCFSEEITPHWLIVKFLSFLASTFPSFFGIMPIVPAPDIWDLLSKEKSIRDEMELNPVRYLCHPRLTTGLQLMMAANDCQNNLHLLEIPFIVLHGKDDRITSCSYSQYLFDHSILCKENKIVLYENVWHLIFEEMKDVCYDDCDQWMTKLLLSGCSRILHEE